MKQIQDGFWYYFIIKKYNFKSLTVFQFPSFYPFDRLKTHSYLTTSFWKKISSVFLSFQEPRRYDFENNNLTQNLNVLILFFVPQELLLCYSQSNTCFQSVYCLLLLSFYTILWWLYSRSIE